MSSDPDEYEDGDGGVDRQVSVGHMPSGSITVGPMSSEGPAEGPLRAIHEVREDLARLRPDVLDSRLDGILARAEAQVEHAGQLPLPLARSLHSELTRSSVASLFSSALRLAELLAQYAEPAPVYPPPVAEADEEVADFDSYTPAPPQGSSYGSAPGTPAKHTPPGPGTGSDDDEWPDPLDG
ncbi:hypothetical protein [Streptomyces sp. 4F14]|uniref:hypothetical protein n=1 Tax=Streptomyces sp. 4F14 TaxID=3394380 RepID=UPI003A8BEFB9